MRDVLDYTSPLWLLGCLADRLVLSRYLQQLLKVRNRIIKSVAESNLWQQYIRGDTPGG